MKKYKQLFNDIPYGTEKLLHYAFESQQQAVCDRVVKVIRGSFTFHNILSPSDLYAIAYVISRTTLQVSELRMCNFQYEDRITILLQELCNNANLCHLTTLEFYTTIHDASVQNLVGMLNSCIRIERVELCLKQISYSNTEHFVDCLKHLKYMQKLCLTYSSTPDGIVELVTGLVNLTKTKVFLSFQCLGTDSVLASGKLNLHTKADLLILNQVHSNLAPDDTVILACGLRRLVTLHTLDLPHLKIGPVGADNLGNGLKCLVNLYKLNLSQSNIGSEGAVSLENGLPCLVNLRELNLSHNYIGPRGIIALSRGLQSFVNLHTLDLSNNKIGPNGAFCLCYSLQYHEHLQNLNLSHNNINTAGVTYLSEILVQIPNLCKLNLSHNNFGPQGATSLAHILRCHTKMLELNISHTNIGPEGGASLANELPRLTEMLKLDLSF